MATGFLNPNSPAGRAAAYALEKALGMPRAFTYRQPRVLKPTPKKKS